MSDVRTPEGDAKPASEPGKGGSGDRPHGSVSPTPDAENREKGVRHLLPVGPKGAAHKRCLTPFSQGTVPVFRSLVWVLPERVARRLAWAVVVLLALVPLVLLLALIAGQHATRPASRLGSLLSKRLSADVRIGGATADASGYWRLEDVTVDVLAVRAARGEYHAPTDGSSGRLDLENGTCALDLDDFTKPPGPRLQKLLADARTHDDLRALSFSGFTVELRLAGVRVSLARAIGRIELTDEGALHGVVSGRGVSGRLSVAFDLGDASRRVTLTGEALPFARTLLSHTFGDALAERLAEPDGALTLGSALVTGTDGDTWQLTATTSLDLATLPPELALGGMTGTAEVTLDAFGPLGGPATLRATLSTPKGGAMSATAFANLAFLLGAQVAPVDAAKPVAFESLDLAVIITRDQLYFTGLRTGRPAALYAPGGSPLLAIPSLAVPLRDFVRRIDELKRRWEAAHSG